MPRTIGELQSSFNNKRSIVARKQVQCMSNVGMSTLMLPCDPVAHNKYARLNLQHKQKLLTSKTTDSRAHRRMDAFSGDICRCSANPCETTATAAAAAADNAAAGLFRAAVVSAAGLLLTGRVPGVSVSSGTDVAISWTNERTKPISRKSRVFACTQCRVTTNTSNVCAQQSIQPHNNQL